MSARLPDTSSFNSDGKIRYNSNGKLTDWLLYWESLTAETAIFCWASSSVFVPEHFSFPPSLLPSFPLSTFALPISLSPFLPSFSTHFLPFSPAHPLTLSAISPSGLPTADKYAMRWWEQTKRPLKTLFDPYFKVRQLLPCCAFHFFSTLHTVLCTLSCVLWPFSFAGALKGYLSHLALFSQHSSSLVLMLSHYFFTTHHHSFQRSAVTGVGRFERIQRRWADVSQSCGRDKCFTR